MTPKAHKKRVENPINSNWCDLNHATPQHLARCNATKSNPPLPLLPEGFVVPAERSKRTEINERMKICYIRRQIFLH